MSLFRFEFQILPIPKVFSLQKLFKLAIKKSGVERRKIFVIIGLKKRNDSRKIRPSHTCEINKKIENGCNKEIVKPFKSVTIATR